MNKLSGILPIDVDGDGAVIHKKLSSVLESLCASDKQDIQIRQFSLGIISALAAYETSGLQKCIDNLDKLDLKESVE
jgi:hypothetical protein